MIQIIKKDGSLESFNPRKIWSAIDKSAARVFINFTDEEHKKISNWVKAAIKTEQISVSDVHNLVEMALDACGFNQVAESASSLGAKIGGVVGTIQGLFNIIYNAVATLINAFASLAEFFVNVWLHPIKTIKNFFLDLLSTILDVVSTVAGVFDLFGTGLSKTLNDASEKLRELKSTEGMYSYGRLELQDVNGIPQAINSGANSAYSAGALVDKYLSQVAGLNSEISDKLSEGIKTDGNGNIKVNDEKNLEMSKEYNKLLQQRATELFKIQYSII